MKHYYLGSFNNEETILWYWKQGILEQTGSQSFSCLCLLSATTYNNFIRFAILSYLKWSCSSVKSAPCMAFFSIIPITFHFFTWTVYNGHVQQNPQQTSKQSKSAGESHQHLKRWSSVRIKQKIILQFTFRPQENFVPYCALSQVYNISHTSRKGFPTPFSSSILFPVQRVEQYAASSTASVQQHKWFQQLMCSLITGAAVCQWVGMCT